MGADIADSTPVLVSGRSGHEAGAARTAAGKAGFGCAAAGEAGLSCAETGGAERTVYYVASDSLGVDREIGCRLAQAFWNSLPERLEEPATFALVNRGIFLALADSLVLEGLRRLAARGCLIYVCGTCLDFYGAHDRLAVGEVGSIPVLQQLMARAAKVITI